MSSPPSTPELNFQPLTPAHWDDFERLFGRHGATGGCWCMWWRCKRSEFERNGNEGNRQAMKAIVDSGVVPGLLGYHEGEPVGWVSVAPRDDYGSLNRSPVLKRIDDRPVWSLVCLFVARAWQGQGIARLLVRGAIDYVAAHGGRVVEAYPTVPRSDRLPASSAYMGTPDLFAAVGFVEVARPSQARMIMRYEIG